MWLQSSADMSNAPPTLEAMEVLARVREALPRLREAADFDLEKQSSENLDLVFAASRSLSGEPIIPNRLDLESTTLQILHIPFRMQRARQVIIELHANLVHSASQ